MALFSAGLKLDRPLTFRDWSTRHAPAAARDAADDRRSSRCSATQLLGLSAAAALLLGAALAPTDPVLAGDIGVGPPGDEDEHEPNFALTAEAGLNDGLAAPFVLAGVFVAERGRERLGAASGSPPTSSTRSRSGVAIGAAAGHAAAVERQAAAQPRHARAGVRRLPRDRHRARDLRAGRAGRRLRLPRRVRRRARVPPLRARPRGQRDRARGRRADREAARARRRSCCSARCSRIAGLERARAGRAGCSPSCCWSLVRPLACLVALARLAHGPPVREGVRRLVRRARRRHALLRRADRRRPARSPRAEQELVVWTVRRAPCSSRSSSTASPPARRCAGCSVRQRPAPRREPAHARR